jgi:hypothetical protein
VPRTACLASADRYLFVWHQKVNDLDFVWGSLRAADLGEIGGGPIPISGTTPVYSLRS